LRRINIFNKILFNDSISYKCISKSSHYKSYLYLLDKLCGMICKNCGQTFEGNFCNQCGQSAHTHRIDFHFLWHDIRHGLFHVDAGILYTFRELYIRPGHSIREFIEGKRAGHFQPISLVILLAVFYGLLFHSFGIDSKNLFDNKDAIIDYKAYNQWISTHYSWMTLATIPLYAIGTQLCFHRQGYNFTELFILNTFKASQRLFLHIATIPILIYSDEMMLKNMVGILYLTDTILSVFTDQQFFDRMPTWKTIFLSLASQLVFLIIVFAIAALWLLSFKHI